MRSLSKKIISAMMSVVMLLCVLSPFGSAVQAEKEKYYPSIVIPGVF